MDQTAWISHQKGRNQGSSMATTDMQCTARATDLWYIYIWMNIQAFLRHNYLKVKITFEFLSSVYIWVLGLFFSCWVVGCFVLLLFVVAVAVVVFLFLFCLFVCFWGGGGGVSRSAALLDELKSIPLSFYAVNQYLRIKSISMGFSAAKYRQANSLTPRFSAA